MSAKHTPESQITFINQLPFVTLQICRTNRDPNHTPSSPFGYPNWNNLSDVLIELDIQQCKNWRSCFNLPNPTFLGSGVLHLHLRMLCWPVPYLLLHTQEHNLDKNDNLHNTSASPHSRTNIILYAVSRQGSNPTSCYRTMNKSVQGHIKWSMSGTKLSA